MKCHQNFSPGWKGEGRKATQKKLYTAKNKGQS